MITLTYTKIYNDGNIEYKEYKFHTAELAERFILMVKKNLTDARLTNILVGKKVLNNKGNLQ